MVRSHVYAILTILIWGSAFTGIAIGLEGFGAGELALFRLGVAAAVLALILWMRKWVTPAPADLWRILLLSAVGIALYHLLLNLGERVVSPGTASFLISTTPVYSLLLARFFGKEQVRSQQFLGVAMSTVGVLLIVLGGQSSVKFSGHAFLIVIAAVSAAIYFVLQRPLIRRYGALTTTSWMFILSVLPLLYYAPSLIQQLTSASVLHLSAGLYIGIAPGAIAYLLWTEAINKAGAAKIVPYMYAVPLVAVAVAWIWSGALPSMLSTFGGIIAIIGVALANSKRHSVQADTLQETVQ